ncbi:MAG TPA: hypothetical protein VFZ41_10685 [Solirubrobacterales bacterium]
MQLRATPPIRLAIVLLLAALAVPVAVGAARKSPATKRVVKLVRAPSGDTVLADLRGRILYSLSAERRGRFICTGGCLRIWPPLLVAKRVKPTGPVRLGRVRRPDGRIQVTYRGRPLYRFARDRRRGEAKGEGIRDVGTWHAAVKPRSSTPPPAQPAPYPGTPYPGTPYPPPPPPPVESPAPSPPPPESPYPYPYGY